MPGQGSGARSNSVHDDNPTNYNGVHDAVNSFKIKITRAKSINQWAKREIIQYRKRVFLKCLMPLAVITWMKTRRARLIPNTYNFDVYQASQN
jgi:hypothetical protein